MICYSSNKWISLSNISNQFYVIQILLSAIWWPFCADPIVLIHHHQTFIILTFSVWMPIIGCPYLPNKATVSHDSSIQLTCKCGAVLSFMTVIMTRIINGTPTIPPLTHWGPDKMAAISQTTFSNAFSWMKMYEFWLRFHLSLFLRVQLTIFQHWFK